ncbi:MAG: FtsW/RodA/SpoVE family cell cycle protein [bacterium]|nr:FtsW/RodA/SpoVE family cell cycle protein [bacterium]
MARFRRRPAAQLAGMELPEEHQLTFAERLDGLTRRAFVLDPTGPALGVFFCVLALIALGFLLQVSHAATTVPPEALQGEIVHLLGYRLLGLAVMLGAFHLGPRGIKRFVPALTAVVILTLAAVYVPFVNAHVNGSRRWLELPIVSTTVQPSELARVVIVLWVAGRCVQLGPRVQDARTGYLPMLLFGLMLFGLILGEPDIGGALLFLICFISTLWVGGARQSHVASSVVLGGGGALLLGVSLFAYVRERLAVWIGESSNDQVTRAAEAIASGDLFGVGFGHGGFRNANLQYMQSDYVFALVGEELGFVGILVVLGLLFSYVWFSLRLVLSIRERYDALVAFGLLVSVAFQAMLHVQVVTGLAPPKGMNLPFISEGGSALIASCLAIGLALGAVRRVPDSPRS